MAGQCLADTPRQSATDRVSGQPSLGRGADRALCLPNGHAALLRGSPPGVRILRDREEALSLSGRREVRARRAAGCAARQGTRHRECAGASRALSPDGADSRKPPSRPCVGIVARGACVAGRGFCRGCAGWGPTDCGVSLCRGSSGSRIARHRGALAPPQPALRPPVAGPGQPGPHHPGTPSRGNSSTAGSPATVPVAGAILSGTRSLRAHVLGLAAEAGGTGTWGTGALACAPRRGPVVGCLSHAARSARIPGCRPVGIARAAGHVSGLPVQPRRDWAWHAGPAAPAPIPQGLPGVAAVVRRSAVGGHPPPGLRLPPTARRPPGWLARAVFRSRSAPRPPVPRRPLSRPDPPGPPVTL